MKDLYEIACRLVWVTQFGFSVAFPPAVCIAAAALLRQRFGLGGWVIVLGVALGVLGAAGGLRSSLKAMDRLDRARRADTPHTFSRDRH